MPSRAPILLALAGWFLLALILCATGWFADFSALGVALTVWGLTIVILLTWWKSRRARSWVDSLPLGALIALHLCRFVGFYFLILGADGRLPRAFAFPAGVGDIAVAFGALALVSSKLVRSRWFVLGWNVVGLADIIAVVFNALRCGLRDWQSMAALRELPLGTLPTFFVPLILASHIFIFVRPKD